jgi:hemerythrin-like domain-containing protein
VFPRLEQAKKLVDVVSVLRRQHDIGRGLTDKILALAQGPLAVDADRATLANALRSYATMMQPHVGHEDTVVFPAFRKVVGDEYDELGDKFEAEEKRHFGEDGFEHYVAQLAPLEAAVGAGLASFTAAAASS